MDDQEQTGILFNIQRSSVHDGPGLRTTIFTKGCNLRCFWCHNPEGLTTRVELQVYASRCLACGVCVQICPAGAVRIEDGVLLLDRELCRRCGQCVDTCPGSARSLSGYRASVSQVVAEVLQDQPFYEASGGGVTISGGEPMLQPAFVGQVLRACKQAGIHTAIETAGNYPWPVIAVLLEWIDLVMMDLKVIDEARHREVTGVSNQRILETARRLACTSKPIIFRTPIIPGVNDTPEAVGAIADWVVEITQMRRRMWGEKSSPIQMELLPFHPLAADKYHSLNLPNACEGMPVPDKELIRRLSDVIRKRGVALVEHS